MEEILVTVNYYIREKLWCSIRNLVDEVSRAWCLPISLTNLFCLRTLGAS